MVLKLGWKSFLQVHGFEHWEPRWQPSFRAWENLCETQLEEVGHGMELGALSLSPRLTSRHQDVRWPSHVLWTPGTLPCLPCHEGMIPNQTVSQNESFLPCSDFVKYLVTEGRKTNRDMKLKFPEMRNAIINKIECQLCLIIMTDKNLRQIHQREYSGTTAEKVPTLLLSSPDNFSLSITSYVPGANNMKSIPNEQ